MQKILKDLRTLSEHQSRFKVSPKFNVYGHETQFKTPEEWQEALTRLKEIQQEVINLVSEYFEIANKAGAGFSLYWREKTATSFRTGINNMSEVQAAFEQELKQSNFWKDVHDYLRSEKDGTR